MGKNVAMVEAQAQGTISDGVFDLKTVIDTIPAIGRLCSAG
jgi:hypothetical protein